MITVLSAVPDLLSPSVMLAATAPLPSVPRGLHLVVEHRALVEAVACVDPDMAELFDCFPVGTVADLRFALAEVDTGEVSLWQRQLLTWVPVEQDAYRRQVTSCWLRDCQRCASCTTPTTPDNPKE